MFSKQTMPSPRWYRGLSPSWISNIKLSEEDIFEILQSLGLKLESARKKVNQKPLDFEGWEVSVSLHRPLGQDINIINRKLPKLAQALSHFLLENAI